MAATSNNKKQVMDVSKPGKTSANATTRPLIIGHGSMIEDPMVHADKGIDSAASEAKPDEEMAPKLPKGPRVLQPISQDTEPTEVSEQASDPGEQAAVGADETTPEPADEPSQAAATDTEASEVSTQEPSSEKNTETPNNEGDGTAVVDAVVDQAAANKKQKEDDKLIQERKEKVTKLIEEKKYFIPIKPPQRTRNGRLMAGLLALLVVLLMAGYAAVDAEIIKPGFDVPFHFLRKDAGDAATTDPQLTTNKPAPAQSTTPTSTDPAPTTATYSSKEYGVSFSYPVAWGEVSAKKQNGSIKGQGVVFTFSKQPLMQAGMLSKDYEEYGRDGTCFLLLGIMPKTTLSDIKSYTKEGDNASNTATSKVTTKILKSTADTFVYENFETGEASVGGCPGVAVFGYKTFATGSYTGIEFLWADPNGKTVPVADFTRYKTDPNGYLSESGRKDILAVVDSAKVVQ